MKTVHFEKLPPQKWRPVFSTLAQLFGVEKLRPCPEIFSLPDFLIFSFFFFFSHTRTPLAPVGVS